MAMVALRATATFGESRPPEKTRRATLGGYATPFANWLTSPSIPLRSSDALIHCWPLPSALGFSGGRLSPKVAVSFAETDHRHTACVGQPKRWNCVKALLAVLCSGRHSANGYGRSSSDRDFRRKSPTRKNPPSNTRRAYATPFANWLTSPAIPLRSSDALIRCWPLPSALVFRVGDFLRKSRSVSQKLTTDPRSVSANRKG